MTSIQLKDGLQFVIKFKLLLACFFLKLDIRVWMVTLPTYEETLSTFYLKFKKKRKVKYFPTQCNSTKFYFEKLCEAATEILCIPEYWSWLNLAQLTHTSGLIRLSVLICFSVATMVVEAYILIDNLVSAFKNFVKTTFTIGGFL